MRSQCSTICSGLKNEALEQMAGKRGAEILYLDDRQENVDAGAARGWQVILQTDPTQSRSTVERLDLLG